MTFLYEINVNAEAPKITDEIAPAEISRQAGQPDRVDDSCGTKKNSHIAIAKFMISIFSGFFFFFQQQHEPVSSFFFSKLSRLPQSKEQIAQKNLLFTN